MEMILYNYYEKHKGRVNYLQSKYNKFVFSEITYFVNNIVNLATNDVHVGHDRRFGYVTYTEAELRALAREGSKLTDDRFIVKRWQAYRRRRGWACLF